MKNVVRVWMVGLILLLAISWPAQSVLAAKGLPGSPDFGVGIWYHPEGDLSAIALAGLQDLSPDWSAIEFSWAVQMPDPNTAIQWASFDTFIQTAAAKNTSIMLSLTNPPAWAMTGQGPDTGYTLQIITQIVNRYPAIQAIELFPGANTLKGWGNTPNPAHYAALYNQVINHLSSTGSQAVLIAGGLRGLAPSSNPSDVDDLTFLQGLYDAGLKSTMPIVSIQLPVTSGDPLQNPANQSHLAVRHYEEIRRVMLAAEHTNGLIWITLINAPDGTINTQDTQYNDLNQQAIWYQQALAQIRSQLYIGVVFIQHLNPASNSSTITANTPLILSNSQAHPFYNVLKAFFSSTNPGTSSPPGKPKGNTLLKCKTKT